MNHATETTMTNRTRAALNHEIKSLYEAAQYLYAAFGTLSGLPGRAAGLGEIASRHVALIKRAKDLAEGTPLEDAWMESLDDEASSMEDAKRRTFRRAGRLR